MFKLKFQSYITAFVVALVVMLHTAPAFASVSTYHAGRTFWLLGTHLTILADRTTTDGKYDLIEGYFPRGTQTPPHRHTRYSEQIYVLEGEFTVWVGKNKVVVGTGESVLIPMGTTHVVAALSDKPARGLTVSAPSGFAQLIEATGTLNENEAPDIALFNRISTEIGDEILGAPGDLPQ